MIHEAFPARRPFQKVVHAPLDVGAGEGWTDPAAVHRHPHGHPGVRVVRVHVNVGCLGGCDTIPCHLVSLSVVVQLCPWSWRAKVSFRQLQVWMRLPMWHKRRHPWVPLIKRRVRHGVFPPFFFPWVNLSTLTFRSPTQTDKLRPSALTFCCAADRAKTGT